tara:strand:- start:571 stop:984 length:414 start_codon:yes stop_codon:yes gene_type:complete
MKPFHHVLLGTSEFMLWYKNDGERFVDGKCPEWYALDQNKQKVGISQRLLTLLPSQCTYYGEWVHKPKFFGELLVNGTWQQVEITNAKMSNDVQNGKTSGDFVENDTNWRWDIKKMTLHKNGKKWLLRIMTPGGYWL